MQWHHDSSAVLAVPLDHISHHRMKSWCLDESRVHFTLVQITIPKTLSFDGLFHHANYDTGGSTQEDLD